jgi:hypothetical protein
MNKAVGVLGGIERRIIRLTWLVALNLFITASCLVVVVRLP